MPCLNNKQHKHNIFHKVKQILIMLLAVYTFWKNLFVYCLGFFLTMFTWKQGEQMGIFTVKRKKKSNVNCSLGHNPFPPPQHFLTWTLSPLPMFAPSIPILCPHQTRCCAACAGCPQGVPRPLYQPEHGTGTLR